MSTSFKQAYQALSDWFSSTHPLEKHVSPIDPLLYQIKETISCKLDAISKCIENIPYMDVPNMASLIIAYSDTTFIYFISGTRSYVNAKDRYSCIHQDFISVVCAHNEMEAYGLLYGTHNLVERYMDFKQQSLPEDHIFEVHSVQIGNVGCESGILTMSISATYLFEPEHPYSEDNVKSYIPEYYCRNELIQF